MDPLLIWVSVINHAGDLTVDFSQDIFFNDHKGNTRRGQVFLSPTVDQSNIWTHQPGGS